MKLSSVLNNLGIAQRDVNTFDPLRFTYACAKEQCVPEAQYFMVEALVNQGFLGKVELLPYAKSDWYDGLPEFMDSEKKYPFEVRWRITLAGPGNFIDFDWGARVQRHVAGDNRLRFVSKKQEMRYHPTEILFQGEYQTARIDDTLGRLDLEQVLRDYASEGNSAINYYNGDWFELHSRELGMEDVRIGTMTIGKSIAEWQRRFAEQTQIYFTLINTLAAENPDWVRGTELTDDFIALLNDDDPFYLARDGSNPKPVHIADIARRYKGDQDAGS